MTDLLIRDVPEGVIRAIDARAKRLGLSRTEYLRRRLTQAAAGPEEAITPSDLRDFAERFADLSDADVMAQAWRTAG